MVCLYFTGFPVGTNGKGPARQCGRHKRHWFSASLRKIPWRGEWQPTSLLTQLVKNPPAMRETWVRSLGQEHPWEEGMATHSIILAWRTPMDRGAWWATVHGVTTSRTQLKRLSMRAFTLYTCRFYKQTVQILVCGTFSCAGRHTPIIWVAGRHVEKPGQPTSWGEKSSIFIYRCSLTKNIKKHSI